MQLEGIVEVDAQDEERMKTLADFGGESFLEEIWTKQLLDGVTSSDERQRELSCGIIEKDIREAAPKHGVYCTPDNAALAIGYLKSELPQSWIEVEEAAHAALAQDILSEDETAAFLKRYEEMKEISEFDWHGAWIENNMPGSDYIHFACLAVDPAFRGTGAFRRLMEPFFDYADTHHIPCMLETYSDKLEQL